MMVVRVHHPSPRTLVMHDRGRRLAWAWMLWSASNGENPRHSCRTVRSPITERPPPLSLSLSPTLDVPPKTEATWLELPIS